MNSNTPSVTLPGQHDNIQSTQTLPLPARRQVTIPGRTPRPQDAQPAAPSRPASVNLSDDDEDESVPAPVAAPVPPVPPVPVVQAAPMTTATITSAKTSQVDSDPDFVSVELPSKFRFYEFKEVSLRGIRVKHQAKFARSANEESTRLSVEAVSSLMGDNVSAMDLTIPDFFWVLYWLRLNNFSKTPMSHRAVCSNPQHVRDVAEGKKDKETLVTVDIIHRTRMEELDLDVVKLEELLRSPDLQELQDKGYQLTAPTMRDSIELEENYSEEPNYKEIEFIAEAAACITPIEGGLQTLEQRMKVIEELMPDTMKVIGAFRELTEEYGVQESVSTKCKECGAVVKTKVSITAYDFL